MIVRMRSYCENEINLRFFLPLKPPQGVFYKRNGSLFFNKVDDSHAGRYSCTPYNELGTEGASPIINVIVQRPPRFTLRPKQIYIHKLGDYAEMSCDAIDRDGRHRPLISWTKVSHRIEFDVSYDP